MDRVRNFFIRGAPSATDIDSLENDDKEQEHRRLEALDAVTISRLATVFVSEVQAALKHADPNNASYVESWKEELLDIFKAQNTDVEGSLISFSKNRFFAARCVDAEVHVHLIYCFAALKVISESEDQEVSLQAQLMKDLLLSTLTSTQDTVGALDAIPRPQLLSLLSLSVARYNTNGIPVQSAVRDVVGGLFCKSVGSGGLSNSLMWYLHEKTTINHLAHDLASIVLADLENEAGNRVEEVWVNGVLSIVAVVVDSCQHGGALLEDFEKANGYVVFAEILKHCSVQSMPILLEAVVSLTFATTAPKHRTRSVSSERGTEGSLSVVGSDRLASNLSAFKMLREVLLFKKSVLGGCMETIDTLSQSEFSRIVVEAAKQCAQVTMQETPSTDVSLDDEVCQQVLDTVLQVYSRHPDNCALLEPQFHMLALYFAGLNSFRSSEVKHMVHSTLEYVSIGATGEVPVHALQAASLTFLGLSEAVLTYSDTVRGFESVLLDTQAVKNTLTRLISFDNTLGEVLCSCGLMDTVLIPLLKIVEQEGVRLVGPLLEGKDSTVGKGPLSVGVMACTLLDELLKASPKNVKRYRDLKTQEVLVSISRKLDRGSAAAALKVLETVAALHSSPQQLKHDILSLSDTIRVQCAWRQCEVFNTLRCIFAVNMSSKDVWRETGGFELMLSTLGAVQGLFSSNATEQGVMFENMTSLILCLLECLREDGEVDSFQHVRNRRHMRDIGYNELARRLVLTGIFHLSKTEITNDTGRYDTKLLHLLFCMVAGGYLPPFEGWGGIAPLTTSLVDTKDRPATIMNADAVLLLLDSSLIECLSERWAALVLQQLIDLATNGGSAAFYRLAHAGVTTYLCNEYYQSKAQVKGIGLDVSLTSQVKRLIVLIGTSHMDVADLSSSLIGLAGSMVKNESVQYNKFDMVANMCESSQQETQTRPSLVTLLTLANGGQSESFAHLGSHMSVLATHQQVADAFSRECRSTDEVRPSQILSKVASEVTMNILTVDDEEQAWNAHASYSLVLWFKYCQTAATTPVRPPSPPTPAPKPPLLLDNAGAPAEVCRNFSDSASEEDDDGDMFYPTERLSLWSAQSLNPVGGFIYLYFDIHTKCFVIESAQSSHPQSLKEVKQVAAFTSSLVEPECWFNLTLVHVRTKRMLGSKESVTLFLNGQSLGVAKLDTPRLENPVLQVFGCPPPAVLHVSSTQRDTKADTLKSNSEVSTRGRGMSLGKKKVSHKESFRHKSALLVVYPGWCLGPVRLISEVITSHGALAIYALGPAYSGNLRGGMPSESVLSVVLLSRLSRIDHASDDDINSMLSYPTTAPGSPTESGTQFKRWDAAMVRNESLLSKLHMDESFKVSEERKERMEAMTFNVPTSNKRLLEANELDDMHLGVNSFIIGPESMLFSLRMECVKRSVAFSERANAKVSADPWHVGDAKKYSNALHLYTLKATSDVAEGGHLSQVVLHGAYDALVQRCTMARVAHGASSISAFFPLLANAQSSGSLAEVLKMLLGLVHGHQGNLEYMHEEGYNVMSSLLYHKFHLFSNAVVDILFQFSVLVFNVSDTVHDVEDVENSSLLSEKKDSWLLVDLFATKLLLLNTQLWLGKVKKGELEAIQPLFHLLKLFSRLLSSNSNFAKTNSRRLLCEPLNFVAHIIHLLVEIDTILHPSPPPSLSLSSSLSSSSSSSPPPPSVRKSPQLTKSVSSAQAKNKDFLLSLYKVGSELLTVLFWKSSSNRDCYLLAQAVVGTPLEDRPQVRPGSQSQTGPYSSIQVHMLDLVFRITTSDPCCSIPSSHGAVPLCTDLLVKCLTPDWFSCAVKACSTSATTAGLLLRLGCRLLQRYQTVDTKSLGIAIALRDLSADRVSASLILPACFLLAGCDMVHCPWNNNSHEEHLSMRSIDDFWAIIETSLQKSTEKDENGNEKKETAIAGGSNVEELCFCGFSLLLDMLKKLWSGSLNFSTDSGDLSKYDIFIVEIIRRILVKMPKVNRLVRSKRFLKLLIELLFVCMDRVDKVHEERRRSSGGTVTTDNGGKNSRSSELSVISDPAMFCGQHGLCLFPLFEGMLVTSLSENTAGVSSFMNNLFSTLPKREVSMLLTYQGFVLKMITCALPTALNDPSEVLYTNATIASKIILEHTIRGMFTTATIEVALEIALSVVRAVCGNKAAVILESKQRQTIAEAVFSAHHLVIIALHRCSVNGTASPSVLSLVRKHSSLLLQRSFVGAAGTSSCTERDLSKTSAFQLSHQDTDELLVVNLVGECLALLTCKDDTIKTDLLHIMSTVLKQRRTFARELLTDKVSSGVDIMTEGFDLLAQTGNKSNDFMVWLGQNPQRDAVRCALERASLQSHKMNPKLASELPGVAIAALQENNMPSSLSSQSSLSKSSLAISTACLTPVADQLVLLHDHWKIEGSEFISRGECIYPALVHRMSGLSVWEGRSSEAPVERFWKLLNHQGADGARRRLVVNHEFHRNFTEQVGFDGTMVFAPIRADRQTVSFQDAMDESVKSNSDLSTSPLASSLTVDEFESQGSMSEVDEHSLTVLTDRLEDGLSLENLRKIARRSMTMKRRSVSFDEDDDLGEEDMEMSPEVDSAVECLDVVAALSLDDGGLHVEVDEGEEFDTYEEQMAVDEATPTLLKGAHEVSIVKGMLSSLDWPPLRCFNIKIVSGLDTTRTALLSVSSNSVSIIEGFGVPAQAIALEKGAITANEDEVSNKCVEVTAPLRLSYDTLSVVYKRRHQLSPLALEFFSVDGSSVLTAFDTEQDAEEMLGRIMSTELPRSLFAKYSGAGGVPQVSKVSFASMRVFGKNKYKSFITTHRKFMTKKWQSGELSNFEYLIHLNTMAGRSFHDLTQYPVMPWVIADYESSVLDLNSPTTFRDLSQPMGALGAARAAQFKERYESLADLRGDDETSIRPFHYGTHYSCAGYVLYYLVRLEPFSRLALQLQGGKFDKPDRLFRDVAASWRSASSENIQDVRELIPEFFSLPEFLQNSNRLDFGEPQKGGKIWDVKLPPWAHDDPHEFVRMQRAALESRYVSERLHLWIDLVFGFKQRGAEAVKAQNVFVHITYENEVDLDAIEDEMERDATLSQIQNFGQTPSRLFAKRPHPARTVPEIVKLVDPSTGSAVVNAVGVLASSKTSRPLESPSLSSVSSPSQALQQLLSDPNKPYTVAVDSNAVAWHKGLSPPLCVVGATHRTSLVCTHVTSLADHTHHAPFLVSSANAATLIHSIHTGDSVGGGAVGDVSFSEDATGHSRKVLCAKKDSIVIPAVAIKKKLLTFSIHDCGVAVSGREKDCQIFENLHLGAVTCLACSSDGSLIVTGGEDAVIHVWAFSKTKTANSNSAVVKSKNCNRFQLSLLGTLNGHTGAVHLLDLCMVQGLLVSGSVDGKVVVWDVHTCSFLHELQGHSIPLKAVSVSPTTGDIVTLAKHELRMWSMSGVLRALTSLLNPACISEVEYNDYMSNATTCTAAGNEQWCLYEGVGVAMGHESGMLSLWRLKQKSLQRAKELSDEFELCSSLPAEVHQRSITCIRVASRGQDMLVGDSTGLVSRWSAPRLDTVSADEALALLLKE